VRKTAARTAPALPGTSFHRFKLNLILESGTNCFYDHLIQTWQAATQSLRAEDTDTIPVSDSAPKSASDTATQSLRTEDAGRIPASDSAPKSASDIAAEDEDSGTDAVETPASDHKEKSAKPKTKKPKGKKGAKCEYFANTGDTHALFKRVTPLWNASTDAMELAEPSFHKERLQIAKTAVQAYDLLGLRDKADDIFQGDFMRSNLFNVAVHADKVFPDFPCIGNCSLHARLFEVFVEILR
jgi:hypothetical protein